MQKKYSEEVIEFIKKHYYDMSSTKIANKIGCSRSFVLKVWIDNGLKGKDKGRQYYFNFNYFKNIDNFNKAYFLGLLASDGNLFKREGHQGQIQITLHKKDFKLLDEINKELNYDKPLYYNKDYCSLTLNSDIFYYDLIKLGLYDKKTVSFKFSNINIPGEYLFDFLRGYFDGDGSIYIKKCKINKNITPCCFYICISGFISNLEEIQKFLRKNNIACQIYEDKRDYPEPFGSLSFGSIKDKYFFLKKIYEHDNLCMERKYLIAKKFITFIENNYKNII